MAKMKIIGIPPGQAPDWVRQEWVGLEMPILAKEYKGPLMGVLGGESELRNDGGVPVSLDDALDILREKSPEAAEWWDNSIFPQITGVLIFAQDVCQIIP